MFDFDELLKQDPPSSGDEASASTSSGSTTSSPLDEGGPAEPSAEDLLEELRSKCESKGFCVDWCGEPEPLESLLSTWADLAEYGHVGLAGLKAEAKNLLIPIEDRMAPQYLQGKFVGELPATAAMPTSTRNSAEMAQQRMLAEREAIASRIKTVLTWHVMSIEQLREECDRRQIQYPLAQSARGENLHEDLVSRLKQKAYGTMHLPRDNVQEVPPWTGAPWQRPVEPSPTPSKPQDGGAEPRRPTERLVPICQGKQEATAVVMAGDKEPPRPFPAMTPIAAMGGAETAAGDDPETFFSKFFGMCLAMHFDSRRAAEPLGGNWQLAPDAKERVPKKLIWKNPMTA